MTEEAATLGTNLPNLCKCKEHLRAPNGCTLMMCMLLETYFEVYCFHIENQSLYTLCIALLLVGLILMS
jgi:hypothetical protein